MKKISNTKTNRGCLIHGLSSCRAHMINVGRNDLAWMVHTAGKRWLQPIPQTQQKSINKTKSYSHTVIVKCNINILFLNSNSTNFTNCHCLCVYLLTLFTSEQFNIRIFLIQKLNWIWLKWDVHHAFIRILLIRSLYISLPNSKWLFLKLLQNTDGSNCSSYFGCDWVFTLFFFFARNDNLFFGLCIVYECLFFD